MRLKYIFEMMDLNDDIIAIAIGNDTEDYHGVIKMNDTAAFVFKLLSNEVSEREILVAMTEEFDESREVLELELHHCIEMLRKRGLLVE